MSSMIGFILPRIMNFQLMNLFLLTSFFSQVVSGLVGYINVVFLSTIKLVLALIYNEVGDVRRKI